MDSHDWQITESWNRIVQGDKQEFAAFVDRTKNLVTSIAYSAIGEVAGSEDVAQETFLVVWLSRHELKEPDKLVGWLCSITRNLARQWVRKRSARSWALPNLDSTDIAQQESHPSEDLISEEEESMVWHALEAIPEKYREVMVLYYRDSQAIPDVAAALDITEDTARQRLSRGRNMLRAEVERKIETALTKSRPTVRFTAGVMSLVAVGSGSAVGQAATATAAGLVGKSSLQTALLASTSTAGMGAALGAAGGVLGALGGLGGTWLGIRVPQLLAPTMTERKLLEREGRVIWRSALVYMLVLIASMALLFSWGPRPERVVLVVLITVFGGVVLSVFCVVRGIRLNRQIKNLRQTIVPEDDPNPTWLKNYIQQSNRPGRPRWIGRRCTSQVKLLGWPIYDFQVSDPTMASEDVKPLHAKGWIAGGDHATGFVAIGGIAKGFVAIGGLSFGVIAFGGLACGLLSMGGMALGALALGGVAIGHSAAGGLAGGWQAVGGLAAGKYSANGGLAIAGEIADGGHAISWRYAVGGLARAPEANTEVARQACRNSWAAGIVGTEVVAKEPEKFRRYVTLYGTVLPVSVSLVAGLAFPLLLYRRNPDVGDSQ